MLTMDLVTARAHTPGLAPARPLGHEQAGLQKGLQGIKLPSQMLFCGLPPLASPQATPYRAQLARKMLQQGRQGFQQHVQALTPKGGGGGQVMGSSGMCRHWGEEGGR